MSKPAKNKDEANSDDEEQAGEGNEIPDHLIRILDGLAQEDDDLELDQAAASLTACIGKGRSALRVRASPFTVPCFLAMRAHALVQCAGTSVLVCCSINVVEYST